MIVLISSVFPPEPVVSATIGYDLAIELSKRQEVKVLTPEPTRPLGYQFEKSPKVENTFEHIVLSSFTYPKSKVLGRMIESISFGLQAARFIRRNKQDIECLYIHSWPLFGQFLIVRMAKRVAIPSILHVVDVYPESLFGKLPFFKTLFYGPLIFFDRFALKNSTKIVTISNSMKELFYNTRVHDKCKIKVIPNWINESLFFERRVLSSQDSLGGITFMFLGSLSPSAAISVIISAFSKANLKNARLVIAGSGTEKDHLLFLAKQSNNSKIEFWDAPISMVPEIQAKADVFIMSLRAGAARFAMPSKLPNYMFSMKPIIGCVDFDSDPAETIKLANCGWIIPPENDQMLAEKMRLVAEMPKIELSNLGKNGQDYAVSNFSKKENLKKFVSVFDEIVNC